MYIKIFLVLSILSCNNKSSENSPKSKINLKDSIKAQVKIKDDARIVLNNNGFVILKNTFNHKNLLTIYNIDGSKWKSFKFNDNFSDEEISPYAIKPENILLVFKYLGKYNGFYKIIVNEDKNITKYIKESDPDFKYQTINEHILTVFSVDFNEKENPLLSQPNEKSQQNPKNKNSFYYPIKISGDFLMVEDDNKKDFWIRWCDEKGNLILTLFYDA